MWVLVLLLLSFTLAAYYDPRLQNLHIEHTEEHGHWSQWNSCNENCGGGYRRRFCDMRPHPIQYIEKRSSDYKTLINNYGRMSNRFCDGMSNIVEYHQYGDCNTHCNNGGNFSYVSHDIRNNKDNYGHCICPLKYGGRCCEIRK